MSLPTLLALAAGLLWGLNMVASRWALDATKVSSDIGAFVSIAVATLVAATTALIAGVDTAGLDAGSIGRYALIGAIAPGASQGIFLAAINSIGPARTGLFVGAAPMFSVILAIAFINEPWRAAVIVGTLLTVAGGVIVSLEGGPVNLRGFLRGGSVLALTTALAFGIRDVAARQFTVDVDIEVWWASTIVLGSGALFIALIALIRGEQLIQSSKRAFPHLAVSGALVGFALPVLIWALSEGDVGIVSPLANAAQIVSVVVVSTWVYGARERSPRLIVALSLVLAGGTLISITG